MLLRDRYPEWRVEAMQQLLANRHLFWGLLRKIPLAQLLGLAEADRSAFLERRASVLLYP
jgi:hypothetical protein